MVSVLGPVQLVVGGAAVPLRPAQRRVLAILLLEPSALTDRDTLIDRMWGEDAPATADAAIHVHLSGIRRAAPGLLASVGGGYRVDTDRYHLDRSAFEQQADRAHAAAAAGDAGAALHAVDRARILWRGTPYPEIAEDDDAGVVIGRLVALRDELDIVRADALTALGRLDEAIAELREAVHRQPLREPAWARLMTALARGGRRAEALRTYQAARATLGAELGIEPGVELRHLEARIVTGEEPAGTPEARAAAVVPTNLQTGTSSFVGRDEELQAVAELLADHRLVTIAGGPGVGKTRLAIEVGWSVLAAYPGGVWFVGLAEARTAGDVAAAIAGVVGVRSQRTTPTVLAERLAHRRALLILDNCEHVAAECAEVCTRLLDRPGAIRLLATSRQPLAHPNEAAWRLTPLPVPPADAGPDPARRVLASPSGRLFVDRVREIDRGFRLTARNARQVAALCRDADGIPLALELAAAWVPGLGLDDVAAMLAGDELPTRGAGSRPVRHRTLGAVLAWSEALLAPEDRDLLHAVAVFRGPFAVEDVVAICIPDGERRRVAAGVRRLVDASLLVADRRDDGRVRLRMLVPIREVALASLVRSEAWDVVKRRFVDHFLGKARDVAGSGMRAVVDLTRVDEDLDNLREAFEQGIAGGRADDVARAIVALDGYFRHRVLALEEREWLERVLPGIVDPEIRARALLAAGMAAQATNDLDAALDLLEEGLASFRALGATDGMARCLIALASLRSNRGEWAEGARAALEGRELAAPDDPAAQGLASSYLGSNLAYGGRVEDGIAALVDAARLFGRSREAGRESHALSTAAFVATLAGDERSARRHAERALRLARRSESVVRIVRALAAGAAIEGRWGDTEAAASLLLELDREMGTPQANEDVFELLLPASFLVRRLEAWPLLIDMMDAVEARIAETGQGYPQPWQVTVQGWRADAAAHAYRTDVVRLAEPASMSGARAQLRAFLEGLDVEAAAR